MSSASHRQPGSTTVGAARSSGFSREALNGTGTPSTFSGLKALLQGLAALLLVAAAPASAGWFGSYQPEVLVSDPYIELHTGPGRGYPIFYVAGQGDAIRILKRRTDWFKVRTPRGKEGWVPLAQMRHTLDMDGADIAWPETGLDDFAARRFEFGFTAGDFGGAAALGGFVGFSLNPYVTLQAEVGQVMGDFASGTLGTAGIVMRPFPGWRASPFFTIGSGRLLTRPQTTIVQAEDQDDEIAHVGGGLDVYLSDRFVLRMEYKRHTVLTSRDDNEEIEQWKAGFSFFL